jgi:endonuclease YncB( thermonuclease family)
MSRAKALLTALFAGAAALACPIAAAAQQRGPCGVGAASPTCLYWFGKVTFISDGDTVSVALAGHSGAPPVRVRLTGIQAMEQSFYSSHPDERRGECHSLEATLRLQHLIEQSKGQVRLAAQDPTSMSGSQRVRRQVSVFINGQWRDVGRILMTEGLTLPLAGGSEWAFNRSYRILARRAARKHIGMFDTSYCGDGPSQQAKLRVWVRSDPEGADHDNLNDEYVTIKNDDPVNPVPIDGWWVRDSGLSRFTFPPGTVVPAGGTVTVHTGQGVNDATNFFWGYRHGLFDNYVPTNGIDQGDGGYLFDPDGDLRAWMMYPCQWSCSDPLESAVKVTGHPRGQESVTVENVSAAPVDLYGYQLLRWPHSYAFPAGSVLQPGDSMRVYVTGSADQDTALVKYWGLAGPFLRENPGDYVKLDTFDYIQVACDSWGSGSCS